MCRLDFSHINALMHCATQLHNLAFFLELYADYICIGKLVYSSFLFLSCGNLIYFLTPTVAEADATSTDAIASPAEFGIATAAAATNAPPANGQSRFSGYHGQRSANRRCEIRECAGISIGEHAQHA